MDSKVKEFFFIHLKVIKVEEKHIQYLEVIQFIMKLA